MRPFQRLAVDGGGEEVVDVEVESVERQNPSGRRELRGPDHVELQHVGIGRAGVEPLHVELMALVGGVGRGLHLHAYGRVQRLEAVELPPNRLAFPAYRAASERQHMWISSSATEADEHDARAQRGDRNASELASHERMVP